MKAATINEIKQELQVITPAKLLDLCIRLAKYKKENKELLGYLLFEAHDETGYIENVKREIDAQFGDINQSNLHFVKKSLRKILRITGKYIRYTGSKQAEVELLLYFCSTLVNSSIPINKSTVLTNLYQFQLKKIAKVVATLHEDLQYDYLKELNKLGGKRPEIAGKFYSAIFEKKIIMELNELFDEAVGNSKTLPDKPGNDILLKLYASYKQSTVGDINIDAPANPFDFVAKAKYNAWEQLRGRPKEAAMQDYIDLVTKLMRGD